MQYLKGVKGTKVVEGGKFLTLSDEAFANLKVKKRGHMHANQHHASSFKLWPSFSSVASCGNQRVAKVYFFFGERDANFRSWDHLIRFLWHCVMMSKILHEVNKFLHSRKVGRI